MIKIKHINKNSLPFVDRMLSTWFGSGLITPAPGTWGSLGALLTYYAGLYLYGQYAPAFGWFDLMIPLTVFLFVVGIDVSNHFEKVYKVKDSSNIVIDEVVGLFLCLMYAQSVPGNFWVHGLLIFALFRLFDIWKPFPIKRIEKYFKGGFGVMIDDLIAAIYAIIAFQIIGNVTKEFFI